MSERIELQKKAKGERPQYFADPAIDKVLSITMALAGEVSVMRDRMDTIERLLANGQPVSPDAVDSYVASPEVRRQRDEIRETFLGNVLRIVHQEREELAKQASTASSYDDAVKLVESDAP